MTAQQNFQKVEMLKEEKAKTMAELERAKTKKRYYENEIKALKAEEKGLLRKARNHRIFTRGGMLEAFIQKPLLLTDEQVYSILKVAFHPKEIGDYVMRLINENEKKLSEDEQAEKTREN